MTFPDILSDKSLKSKQKVEALGQLLTENPQRIDELVEYAKTAKEVDKANCIEAMEWATNKDLQIATPNTFEFVSAALADKAPRIKWESAKVIGIIAHLFPGKLDDAIKNLLANTEHEGTVVRWATAFALGNILKLKTGANRELLPTVQAIADREEKNSIKKIYLAALHKIR